ncbi:MAG TPA: MaoC/PaaZ C-terminal domain-containing protein [Burkholderiales bacterium]|nr:MaoC/PaaZ C-terminal domain-containing protein [Burkholderiales bacterium]
MKTGDTLPVLEKTFTTVDLFAYGAATWDWHRMHYDAELVRSKGFAAPVIDGQMYGALFARVAMQWAGPRAFIMRMSLRMKSMAFAGDTLRAEGSVTEVEGNVVVVSQTLTNAGRVCAEATTRIRLSA